MKSVRVLGIETSCDECSASIVELKTEDSHLHFKVLSNVTHSQIDIHAPYGGVVPEIASRNHLETIHAVIDNATSDAQMDIGSLDAIAVTNRPGLVGALLVGVSTAKALAYAYEKPLCAVHHLEGHAMSVLLNTTSPLPIQYPLLIAVVSGGHTNLYVVKRSPLEWEPHEFQQGLIARSKDDAAGEAFDKTAKLLGFPYPGGKYLDEAAQSGNPERYHLPRALPSKEDLNFSFSGLKTSASLLIQSVKKEGPFEKEIPNLAASIQEAIVDSLVTKILAATDKHTCKAIAIVGGVAANSRLKSRMQKESKVPVFSPPLNLCTDNGAMIAAAGALQLLRGESLELNQYLRLNAIAYPPI